MAERSALRRFWDWLFEETDEEEDEGQGPRGAAEPSRAESVGAAEPELLAETAPATEAPSAATRVAVADAGPVGEEPPRGGERGVVTERGDVGEVAPARDERASVVQRDVDHEAPIREGAIGAERSVAGDASGATHAVGDERTEAASWAASERGASPASEPPAGHAAAVAFVPEGGALDPTLPLAPLPPPDPLSVAAPPEWHEESVPPAPSRLPWLAAAALVLVVVLAAVVLRPFGGGGQGPALPAVAPAASGGAPAKASDKSPIPFSNQTPVPEKQPTLESVSPAQAKKGDKVSVKGQNLQLVLCSASHPEGLDPHVWLKPVSGGDKVNMFHFNEARYIDGVRDNGEWTDTEIYWEMPIAPAGKYKLYINTACASSNELDFEVLPD